MKTETDLNILGWCVSIFRTDEFDSLDLPWFPPGDKIIVYINCRPEAPLCYTSLPEEDIKIWPKETMCECLKLIAHHILKGDVWEFMSWQEKIKPVYEKWAKSRP